ncbi:MAG: F0F1 ATP synthase subunit A [Chloroflexota bacterium]
MDLHVSIKAETLFSIGPLDITNSFITMILVMAGLLIAGHMIARKLTMVPTHGQSILEMTVEFVLGLVESAAGKNVGRRIFPLIGGLFIYIIVANYAGLLPGVGTIGWNMEEEGDHASVTSDVASVQSSSESDIALYQEEDAEAGEEHHEVLVPFFRSPSADLNMTLAMSLFVIAVVQVAGIMAHGVVGRIKHMADPWWIFPLEIIQELARIVSLAFRLFGNVFAGEVLVAVMVAFGAATYLILAPVTTVFLYLEVLFGFVQALVFALLSLIYLALATAGGHGDEESHGH